MPRTFVPPPLTLTAGSPARQPAEISPQGHEARGAIKRLGGLVSLGIYGSGVGNTKET